VPRRIASAIPSSSFGRYSRAATIRWSKHSAIDHIGRRPPVELVVAQRSDQRIRLGGDAPELPPEGVDFGCERQRTLDHPQRIVRKCAASTDDSSIDAKAAGV
jgi:hypothetical protein